MATYNRLFQANAASEKIQSLKQCCVNTILYNAISARNVALLSPTSLAKQLLKTAVEENRLDWIQTFFRVIPTGKFSINIHHNLDLIFPLVSLCRERHAWFNGYAIPGIWDINGVAALCSGLLLRNTGRQCRQLELDLSCITVSNENQLQYIKLLTDLLPIQTSLQPKSHSHELSDSLNLRVYCQVRGSVLWRIRHLVLASVQPCVCVVYVDCSEMTLKEAEELVRNNGHYLRGLTLSIKLEKPTKCYLNFFEICSKIQLKELHIKLDTKGGISRFVTAEEPASLLASVAQLKNLETMTYSPQNLFCEENKKDPLLTKLLLPLRSMQIANFNQHCHKFCPSKVAVEDVTAMLYNQSTSLEQLMICGQVYPKTQSKPKCTEDVLYKELSDSCGLSCKLTILTLVKASGEHINHTRFILLMEAVSCIPNLKCLYWIEHGNLMIGHLRKIGKLLSQKWTQLEKWHFDSCGSHLLVFLTQETYESLAADDDNLKLLVQNVVGNQHADEQSATVIVKLKCAHVQNWLKRIRPTVDITIS